MARSGRIQGVAQHRWFGRLLSAGVRTGSDLHSWMHASFPSLNASLWDTCLKKADEFLETGVNVFRWVAPKNCPPFAKVGGGDFFSGPLNDKAPPQSPPAPCPAVLFGKGGLDSDLPLLAVFNSRKPRLVSPDSDWLKALRFFFRALDSREIGLAGSTGTLAYDLAGALALRSGLPQLLVAPFPLLKANRELSRVYGEGARGITALSCMLDTVTCSKKQAPVCRDRTLAALANLHLVLEIRSRGNLLAVLAEIQAKSPRPQFVFEPGETDSSNAGNHSLLTKFPEYAHGFKLPCTPDSAAANPVQTQRPANKNSPRSSKGGPQAFCYSPRYGDVAPGNYLFHYTRACAGPWPGEPYHQYLADLLDAHPLSGHSALETLIRIVQEGLIRAGSRMVRGRAAVISWSSHPPRDLFLMRKWNRALLRWTVEPYGVAVRRDILLSLGAKPAVYGSEQIYFRLPESERYRFQLSRSARSASWRHEREWRVRGDLALGKIKSDQGFVFVQTKEEEAKLCTHVKPELPIVVLND